MAKPPASEMITHTEPPGFPKSWEERIASYPQGSNALLEIVRALDELDLLGSEHTATRHHRSGLPDLDPKDIEALLVQSSRTFPMLKMLSDNKRKPITDFRHSVYDTGYSGSRAFNNAVPYAPISILVCPTKPYLNFEHFASTASAEEVGEFFKSVNKVALDAVREFDERVEKNPEKRERRDFYERAFATIRDGRARGKTLADYPHLTELVMDYARESKEYGFAVRGLHSGHSGFRISINNGSPSAGMSQPHLHAQIIGGRYLGGIADQDPAKHVSRGAFSKLADSLTR